MLFWLSEESLSTVRDTLTRPLDLDAEESDTDPLSHARMQKNTKTIRQMIAFKHLAFIFKV